MDHYQTKVKESEATPPPSTTNTTRKRKASAQLSSNKVAGKKAKRKSKNHEQPDPILPEAAIDTNMDLVLQLKTTPRKSATLVKPTCQDTLDNIPNALGLVPKEAVPETNETFITPSKPLDNIDRKKTPRKAVQRNLLDDVGFKSPLKPPPGLSPARSSLTPIKLTQLVPNIRATIVLRCSNAPDLKADSESVRIFEISQQMPKIPTFFSKKEGKKQKNFSGFLILKKNRD